jgi:ArsR family transcriptional regulator
MDTDLDALDRTLKALADPTRVRILGLLQAGEVCVCHLYETLGITQTKASRHLAYLREAGLVATSKRGQWVYYRLAPRTGHFTENVVSAVQHCISHLPQAQHDAARLYQKTGCCVVAAPAPEFACCAPAKG